MWWREMRRCVGVNGAVRRWVRVGWVRRRVGAASPYWHAGMLMCENVGMLKHRRLHADTIL